MLDTAENRELVESKVTTTATVSPPPRLRDRLPQVQNSWLTISQLPRYLAEPIRALGKSLFSCYTRTPLDKILLMARVQGFVLNTAEDFKALQRWARSEGTLVSEGTVDFPLWRIAPVVRLVNVNGLQLMFVKDPFGEYVYAWPQEDGRSSQWNNTAQIDSRKQQNSSPPLMSLTSWIMQHPFMPVCGGFEMTTDDRGEIRRRQAIRFNWRDSPRIDHGTSHRRPVMGPKPMEITLLTGRLVKISTLYQFNIYVGFLSEPMFDPEYDLLQAIYVAETQFPHHKMLPVVLEPWFHAGRIVRALPGQEESVPWLKLPSICTIAEFISDRQTRSSNEVGSSVLVIWFQDHYGLPEDERILGQLSALDWKTHSQDWEP